MTGQLLHDHGIEKENEFQGHQDLLYKAIWRSDVTAVSSAVNQRGEEAPPRSALTSLQLAF